MEFYEEALHYITVKVLLLDRRYSLKFQIDWFWNSEKQEEKIPQSCIITFDYLYMTYADGYGNRAVFQGKHALEGKAKATIDAWVQKYESADFSSDAEFCAVMEQNKKDKTLLGALFIWHTRNLAWAL